MKKLIIALVVFVALIAVAVGVGMKVLDPVAKRVVESSGTAATGVITTTDSVTVSILTGNIGIKKLNIPNVGGFKTDHLMNVGSTSIDVVLSSALGDTLDIPQITIENTHLNIEQQGLSNNVSAFMDKMKASKTNEPPAESKGKKLKIGRIVLKNTTATVQTLPIGGNISTLEVTVPEIVLENVTPDNASSVATPEIIRRVIPAILAAVVQKGGGIIPEDLRNILTGDVGKLAGALGGEATKLLGEVGGELGNVVKSLPDVGKVLGGDGKAGDAAKKVEGAAGDAAKKVGEGIKNIFK